MMKMSKTTHEKTSYVNHKKSTYEFIQEKFVSLLQIVTYEFDKYFTCNLFVRIMFGYIAPTSK